MSKIAYCGLDCEGCPAFIAYQTDDQALRVKTAGEWSSEHGADIKPDDINCTGCISTGIQFPWCSTGCPIRQCALSKQVASCGICADYPCQQLGMIHDNCPDAKQRLDEMMPR